MNPIRRTLTVVSVAALASLGLPPLVRGALVLDLPDLILQPNQAGQVFTLSVENTGPAVSLTGLQLELTTEDGGPQVGGTRIGPAIRGGSLTSPGLFFASNNNGETGEGNFGGLDQLFQLRTSTASGSVAMGIGQFDIAQVVFDTTGDIQPGVYEWHPSSLNGLTFFTGTGVPVEIFPTLSAGSLTVVPEPRDYALVAGLGTLGFALWRRLSGRRA